MARLVAEGSRTGNQGLLEGEPLPVLHSEDSKDSALQICVWYGFAAKTHRLGAAESCSKENTGPSRGLSCSALWLRCGGERVAATAPAVFRQLGGLNPIATFANPANWVAELATVAVAGSNDSLTRITRPLGRRRGA